jgi:hypothetical protein
MGELGGTASATQIYLKVTNLPPFTAIRWPSVQDHGNGQDSIRTTVTTNDTLQQYRPHGTYFELLTNVGGTTPPGTYKIFLDTSTINGARRASDVPVFWDVVVTAPTVLAQNTPASMPPIPNLNVWESNMVAYSDPGHWCLSKISSSPETWAEAAGRTRQTICSPWSDFCSMYYDGERVWLQILDYTQSHGRLLPYNGQMCADASKRVYRDLYFSPGLPLYRRFPLGLYMDFTRTGDTTSQSTLLQMATQGNVYDEGFFVSSRNIRETAYQLEVDHLASKLGHAAATARLDEDVNLLLGQVSQITDSGNAEWVQPFMCGLAAEALIEWYEDGHQSDTRIPVALKKLGDWLWANAWGHDVSGNGFYYNSKLFQFGIRGGSNQQNLNLLVVPLWGWLYRYTGDVNYLNEGDFIWNLGVIQEPGDGIDFSGKNFSQQYRWSFNYVAWRGGK